MAIGAGDWMKLQCGDRVSERDGRHIGRVEAQAGERRMKPAVTFPLGQVMATPGALHRYRPEELAQRLGRHARGDWGDLDAEDIAANKSALRHGSRIFSSYRMPDGEKLWIITEADRSATTFLLPDEY
jgi:hypothetical protein